MYPWTNAAKDVVMRCMMPGTSLHAHIQWKPQNIGWGIERIIKPHTVTQFLKFLKFGTGGPEGRTDY